MLVLVFTNFGPSQLLGHVERSRPAPVLVGRSFYVAHFGPAKSGRKNQDRNQQKL